MLSGSKLTFSFCDNSAGQLARSQLLGLAGSLQLQVQVGAPIEACCETVNSISSLLIQSLEASFLAGPPFAIVDEACEPLAFMIWSALCAGKAEAPLEVEAFDGLPVCETGVPTDRATETFGPKLKNPTEKMGEL